MKINGMCPICYIRRLFSPTYKVSEIPSTKFDNGNLTPPLMGWSSWNTFQNRINEDIILDVANAMVDSGLKDAGYNYLNIDDNWMSSERDKNGDLQGDLVTFGRGIYPLINEINKKGLKVGLYASNGTKTCQDLPSCLGREKQDALTIARFGAEFFKYDFCHNIPYSKYAPLIYGIEVAKKEYKQTYLCDQGKIKGFAKIMHDKNVEGGRYVSGLDKNGGSLTFDNVEVDSDGTYILTLLTKKIQSMYEKYIVADIDGKLYGFVIPKQHYYHHTARFQTEVYLKKGKNTIKLFNPIKNPADSALLQYRLMSSCLNEASKKVAEENNQDIKPITFSICEWGWRKPWLWGASCGNQWRTTPDITPSWPWIELIYEHNIRLYKYADKGHYNDPDMLEVGNGKLTYDENISHFSLWCMMDAPLVLGNDVRNMSQDVKNIVTNKHLISINQDALCVSAKKIKGGIVDIIAKPMVDGQVAVCFFNKGCNKNSKKIDIDKLVKDKYLNLKKSNKYKVLNCWDNKEFEIENSLSSGKINKHGSNVYIIKPL